MAIKQPTSAPVVHLVKIRDVKKATWNPKQRVSERRLLQLRLSMDHLGLYYPILIDETKNLIDGHRRLAIAESFGWTVIPAITIVGGHDESYGSVQLTQQKLTGNDMLGVFLIEPNALLKKQRQRIEQAQKALGKPLLKAIYDAGMSVSVYSNARRIGNYIGETDLAALTAWIIKHRLGILGPLIKGGMPPRSIRAAFKADRPITVD